MCLFHNVFKRIFWLPISKGPPVTSFARLRNSRWRIFRTLKRFFNVKTGLSEQKIYRFGRGHVCTKRLCGAQNSIFWVYMPFKVMISYFCAFYNKRLMTGPAGNSEFCFASGTLRSMGNKTHSFFLLWEILSRSRVKLDLYSKTDIIYTVQLSTALRYFHTTERKYA